MYKVYYAQRYRVKKFETTSSRLIKIRNKAAVREKYKHEKKINPSIKYDNIKDSNYSSFTRVNTLFKARKQVNV